MSKFKTMGGLAFFAILLFFSCQRDASDRISPIDIKGEFTKAFTKQWYLKSFKKTSEWKTARLGVNKFPSFKEGTYRKEKSMEIWEFPLRRQKKQFLIQQEKQALSDAQKRKVVSSSISRVLFIKTPSNRIVVREVNYIPYWNYLVSKQFDISKVGFKKQGDDFTGNMIVKDWNGKVISNSVFKDGKVVRRGSLGRKTMASRTAAQARAGEYICEPVEYCMWYEECTMIGDVMTDDCGDPYMDGGDCYTDEQCYWDGEDDDDPCAMYGECEGDDTGGAEENPQDNIEAAAAICDKSFRFSKFIETSNGVGGWQVAGTKDIHMNIIDLTTRQAVRVTLPTMYFGLPVLRSTGEFYSTSGAAKIAADAVEYAEGKVMEYYHSIGGNLNVVGMTTYYREKISEFMQTKGGTAGLTPGSNINVTDIATAQYGWPIIGCL